MYELETRPNRARPAGFAATATPLALAAMLTVALPGLVLAGQGLPGSQAHAGGHDRRDDRPHDSRGYVYDGRYNHNHYYPPRGYAVGALPRGYVTVNFRGGPYYYHQGVWYRSGGGRFVVVRPAVGLYVPFLPPFYTTVWFGGLPFYYADDVYYAWRPERREYVVVDPPNGASASTVAPSEQSSDLFIYPKNGQSEEQQSKDKYECHSWAASQSGFDPTQPLGGVPDSQATARRQDYQRARQACLEARGYSVK
jgi:Family of unknown function (DUF6515)